MSLTLPSANELRAASDDAAGADALARRDLVYALLAAAIVFVIVLRFDLAAALFDVARLPHARRPDELLLAGLVLIVALSWYCARRWHEALRERALRERLDASLARRLEHESALLADNRRLLARLSSLQEEERVRIAQELHDAFGQHLTAINANASAITGLLDGGATVPMELPQRIIDSIEFLAASTRAMLTTLRPPSLSAAGLVPAARDLVAEWQRTAPRVRWAFRADGTFDAVPDGTALTIYRILQESLQNCVRHSAAGEVQVTLRITSKSASWSDLEAIVEDNGIGFDPARTGRGLGVLGMRERARALHGRVDITPRRPQGTKVHCVLPLPVDAVRQT
ncbi:MAG: sensor histidine kinase [Gammaproteobacteria bacterium]